MNSAVLILRRSFAICPTSVDDYMKHVSFDLSHKSNQDIVKTTNALKSGKFTHPRARQMAAAARYGWKFSTNEAFHPELWTESLVSAWNNQR